MAEQQPKIEILGDDDTCLTFVVRSEGHTLGNALRYILMKNKDVDFCGYSIPHPSEDKMQIRVQTCGKPAIDVFRQAVKDLRTMTEHIRNQFGAQCDIRSMESEN